MPKITYVPSDRLDPMYNEAPTRYSPRIAGEAERKNAGRELPDRKGAGSDRAKKDGSKSVDSGPPSRSSEYRTER